MNYNSEGQPIIEVTGIEVHTEIGPLVLTWLNTVIKTFRDPTFNHVEYTDEKDNRIGFLTPESVIDALLDHEFPYTFNPLTDEATFNWYVGIQADGLERELGTL